MGKSNTDEMFLNHYNGARSVGLKVGAYHYSYALTPEEYEKNPPKRQYKKSYDE